MTSKLTRERIELIANFHRAMTLPPSHAEIEELARMALAAMDSEPAPVVQKTAHSSVIAEQLANVLSEMKVTDHQRAVISCAVDRLNNVAQLLQLSPSALLVPEILDYQGAKELYNYLMTEEETNATVNGWNACRATMLQASPVCTCPSGDGSLRWPCPVHPGNSPAIPDSARDALEKALAAMEFMGDTLNNLDAVCTEDVELVAPAFDAVRNVLAAAPHDTPALNSLQSVDSVTGGWIPVSERMPEDRISVILWDAEIGEVTSGHYSHKTQTFYHCGDAIENEITHWMPPPCAPQEVK
ncbi:DUF551 domain-containing protein [Klebsiella pneumoniae]|uniref:DUF551 domain-containing protein n=1 Tax=Klebsiella pneumoniae TaxID=573 RepID=UPI0038D1E828